MVDNEIEEPRTHYHYSISLRMTQPSMSPEKISAALGIEPRRCWEAGKARQTPKGTPLEGVYRESYWTADVSAGRYPKEINEAIHETLEDLTPHRSFIHRIREESGTVELFIGWFFENQSGDRIAHQSLLLAGDLKVDLSFDVYPPEQPQHEHHVENPFRLK